MATRKRATNSSQDDLFNPEVELLLPARLSVEGKVLGTLVRQLAVPALRVRCRLRPFSIRRVAGHEATHTSGETLKIISAKTATPLEADLILLVAGVTEPERMAEALNLGEGRWDECAADPYRRAGPPFACRAADCGISILDRCRSFA